MDEGTANYDGDGDGYSLINGDCDDQDPERNPTAVEYCDGFDNDCDYLVDHADDEGCEPIVFPPQIVGGCLLEDRSLVVGQSTTATVFVNDIDSQNNNLVFEWQEDIDISALGGHIAVNSPFSQTITWTAPSTLDGASAALFTIYMTVTDDDGHQDWCFDEITVYSEAFDDTWEVIDTSATPTQDSEGCGGGDALVLVPIFGLAGLRRRRKRQP